MTLTKSSIAASKASLESAPVGVVATSRRLSRAADSGHHAVVHQDLVDREPLAQLGASGDRRLDQQVVEHDPAWAEPRRHAVERPWAASDLDRPEIERVPVDRRADRGLEALEHR